MVNNMRSDIFDAYVKIAQDKGLISEDAPEKAKKKLERERRADSLDIKAIEALYGVKPDAPKDMQYDKNISQLAHPTPMVISPAHDKLNGLVENINERQNILLHIVNKVNNGQSTHHKYAQKDLILSLVRLGNLLDVKKEYELCTLADSCLQQVSVPLKKQAILLPAIAGVAALIGALYAQQHLRMTNQGFDQNHQQLISEIDDLLNSNSNWGVGNDYSANFKRTLQDFKAKLTAFYELYKKNENLLTELETPKTALELWEVAKQPETGSVIAAYKSMSAAFENMRAYLTSIEKNFSNTNYKNRQITDKGWISGLIDKTEVLHGGKGLIADDFDDVVRALAPYKQSVDEMLKVFLDAGSIEKNAVAQIQEAAMQSQKASSEAPEAASTGGNLGKSQDFDMGISDLENELSSGLTL